MVTNFRKSWEELSPETERADEYGLGQRDGLQEAVEAVINTLGMQPCEGTEAVPPNARSHTVLLAGIFVGYQQVRSWDTPPCVVSFMGGCPVAVLSSDQCTGVYGREGVKKAVLVPMHANMVHARESMIFVSDQVSIAPLQVLVRLSFGLDGSGNVAMKLVVRAESEEISDAVHQIIQSA